MPLAIQVDGLHVLQLCSSSPFLGSSIAIALDVSTHTHASRHVNGSHRTGAAEVEHPAIHLTLIGLPLCRLGFHLADQFVRSVVLRMTLNDARLDSLGHEVAVSQTGRTFLQSGLGTLILHKGVLTDVLQCNLLLGNLNSILLAVSALTDHCCLRRPGQHPTLIGIHHATCRIAHGVLQISHIGRRIVEQCHSKHLKVVDRGIVDERLRPRIARYFVNGESRLLVRAEGDVFSQSVSLGRADSGENLVENIHVQFHLLHVCGRLPVAVEGN